MTTNTVFRDKEGNVINIGPWDYFIEKHINPQTGNEEVIIHNPLPDGATETEEEIITLPDGGLAVDE